MNRRLILRKDTDNDIEAAWLHYSAISSQLGQEFLEDVIDILDYVQEFPELYQTIHRNTRRAVLHRFPYSVWYRLLATSIEVIGLLPSHGDPRQSLSRATGKRQPQ